MDKRYVLFDLDGTLTNSYEGIVNALVYSLSKMGIEPQPDKFRKVIGPPLRMSYHDIYGLSPAEIDRAIDLYHEYYDLRGKYENTPYDGVIEMLQTLHAHDKKLMIATSKPEQPAVDIAEHFGLAPYLCFIAGVNNDAAEASTAPGARSNKSDVIRYILSANDIKDPENAVMVGDRSYDITAARELGLQTVGVLYGFGSRAELEEAGAQYLAETPMDVARYIVEN